MIRSVGVDPDVHACAFAQVCEMDDGEKVLRVWTVRQCEFKGREAAIATARNCRLSTGQAFTLDVLTVEGQDVRYTGKTSYANPQDICNLALITGAVIALSNASVIYSPLPREWKGTVPKGIKQCRILDGLGINYTMHGGKDPYPVPVDFEQYCVGKVNASDWKDLTDAVGLAAWGLEKYKKSLCSACRERPAEAMGGLCLKCDHVAGDR